MLNILLTGDLVLRKNFVDEFILENKYLTYEIEKIIGKINVERVREIKKSLFFKTKSKKLIILEGEFSIGAQNALLKVIEETSPNVLFMLSVDNRESVLPTVTSRCKLVQLGTLNNVSYSELLPPIRHLALNESNFFEEVEIIIANSCLQDTLTPLFFALRNLLLESLTYGEKSIYYVYCKRLLSLIALYTNNNVNKKIIIEKIFADF